jgi:zinc ribbon protein
VEHACHRCGRTVEDGVPFCKNCGAPQIRVAGTVAPPEVLPPEGPNEQAGPSLPQPASASFPEIPGRTAILWSQALPGAALAGLIATIGIFLGPGMFGVGMLVAGFLSVALYRRRLKYVWITNGMGAKLGAAAGAIGSGLFTLVTAVGILVFHAGDKLREAAIQAIDQAAARNPDPKAQEMLQQLKTPDGLVLVVSLGMLFTFVLFVLLSSLGGVIGAASLRKKRDF